MRLFGFILLCLVASLDMLASDGIETAGTVIQLILPTAAGGLTLVYRDYQGTLQFGESTAVALGVTYALKYSVNETRPNGGAHSFPSAHTSISFSSAEFLRKRYGWEYGLPAYAAASFVGYSRVESREHYTHDVVAGAAIGIVSSYIFTKPYKGWTVETEAGVKSFSISLSRSW